MTSFSGTGTTTHPLVAGVAAIGAALDAVTAVDATFLPPTDKADLLLAVHRERQRLHALELALIAASDDVAETDGSRTVAAWLAPRVNADHGPVHAQMQLARVLDTRWTATAAATRVGSCTLEQARVIARALDDLPRTELGPELLARAEAYLLECARRHTPAELRRLGDKLLEVIAPDLHEDAERAKLDREERHARRTTRLNFHQRGDGTTDIHARVPSSVATRLRGYLDAHTAPRHQAATGPDEKGAFDGLLDPDTGERITSERARGLAFCAMLERIDPATQPLHGGAATTLVLTMTLRELLDGLGIATLPDGTAITADQARRLACNAGLIPAVLGTRSEVLDLGRTGRLITPAQRRAKALQHPTCQTRGCTVPAAWCEGHHRHPWHLGGHTDLKDLDLLCAWHHHRAHDERYDITWHPNGEVSFHRRG